MAGSEAEVAPRKRVRLIEEGVSGRKGSLAGVSERVSLGKVQSGVTESHNLDHARALHTELSAGVSKMREASATTSDNKLDQSDAMLGSESTREETGQITTTDSDDLSASEKVWNTTELLEQIICHLPVTDMVVVSGVNKMSYNCFNNSKFAQSKLFLQPSNRAQDVWWYCEFRKTTGLFQPDGELVAQTFELSEKELRKLHILRTTKTAQRVSVVTLCPLLQLTDCQEETALGRIKRKTMYDERACLIGVPAENTKYANMILTDPPIHHVSVELTYKHNLYPLLMVRARRNVVDASSPLTFSTVVNDTCQQVGDLFVHDPPRASNNYKTCHYSKPNSSINAEILLKVQEYGGHFMLDPKNSELIFRYKHVPNLGVEYRIVVPTTKERLEMEAKRAKLSSEVDDNSHS